MIDSIVKHVDAARLEQRLAKLYELGHEPGHRGAMRLAFSAADRRGRDYVLDLMRQAGISPRIDQVGNLIGVLRGSKPKAASLILGSHLDTVPQGGKFDGALGVLGGLEVVEAMQAAGYEPAHPIEVIAFSNEEKARFTTGFGGSLAMVCGIKPEDLEGVVDGRGVTLVEAMKSCGLDPELVSKARRPSGFCRAYLELHVEQGGRMLKSGEQVGVVTAIVGISRAHLTFKGRANHAGTTMMEDRSDALWAAAEMVRKVREAAVASQGGLVGTVGILRVLPGAANVVPGEASLTIELRSADEALKSQTLDDLLTQAGSLAERWHLELTSSVNRPGGSVPLDQTVQSTIAESAQELGIPHRRIHSWAGHDASVFAPVAPTGMLFVPSQAGISHSPDEYTHQEDVLAGVRVLAATVARLDRLYAGGTVAD